MTFEKWLALACRVLGRAKKMRDRLRQIALDLALQDQPIRARNVLRIANRVMPVAERYLMEMRNQ